MNHMTLTLIFKPRLKDFSLSVLHFTMFLLLLTNSSRGQSQSIGSSQPIVAMVGDDIILPCYLEPAVDARDLTVEWTRSDLDPRIVHLKQGGVEILPDKNPSYSERTSLSTDKLKRGDVSLKLSKVKLSDAGTYRCLVPTSGTECVVELTVGSVSPPELKISKDGVGVLLHCESKGWYPKPEVLWLDGEGKLLSAGPAEPIRGPDGLYTVSSRVTVEKKHSKSFTCRVQQKNINQTRETHVHVEDELFMVQTSSAVHIAISLVAVFLCIAVILLVVWKVRQNKTKTTENISEFQLLMEEEKMKYFEKTQAKLEEELQKNREDEERVEHVIAKLTNQKEDLKTRKDQLSQLQKDTEQMYKTMEEPLKPERKKKEHEKLIKKTEKLQRDTEHTKENMKEPLNPERKKEEHEELIEKTDKLQKTTDELIINVTDRKAKLKRDKEQINTQLKETQRQIEELQKNLQSEQQDIRGQK